MNSELDKLRKEYELSGIGDRPYSISAAKLKRLIELERAEVASRENCADCFGDAASCVDVCGSMSPLWRLARKIAAEMDRQALLYNSRDDQPLTDDELAPIVVVLAGTLTRSSNDAATRMRDRCVARMRRKADGYQKDSERSDFLPNYRKNMALAASVLREVANDLQSLTLEGEQEKR